jgi:hypothetical protein
MRTMGIKANLLKVFAAVCAAAFIMLTGCGDKKPENVKITPESTSVQEGEKVRFEAAALTEAGERLYDADISWRVEGDAGTIDGSGIFTATREGSAQVIATSGEVSGRAEVTVTPPPPQLASIRIEPEQTSVEVGGSVKFEASGISDKGQEMPGVAIDWSIEGEAGSISDQGHFQALKPGEAAISARSGEFAARADITVEPPTVTGIRVDPDREKGLPGTKLTVTVTATAEGEKPAGYATVNIRSSNPAIRLSSDTLSLDDSGVGTVEADLPPEPGMIDLVFESGEVKQELKIEATRVTRLEIEPGAGPYEAGQTVHFQAVGYDIYGNSTSVEAEWSITGDAARSETGGKVIMTKPGDGIVLASQADILAGQPFTVEAGAPAEVRVSPAEVSLQSGNSVSFGAETLNSYGYPLLAEVAWKVEGDIGSVSEDGFFQARKVGEGRVVAESNGVAGAAEVKVGHGPLASVIIDIDKTTITAGQTAELKAYGADVHGNRFDITPEWFISKSLGAIDKEAGTFTARYAGTGEIRALAEGTSGARTIEVVPADMVRLEISPAKVDLIAGESVAFDVQGYDEFGNIVDIDPVFSLADDLGSLEKGGLFESRASGTTVVTAAADKLEARATVTVATSNMVRVTMEPSEELTLRAGSRQQFIAQGYDEFGNVAGTGIKWSVSPELGEMGPQGSFFPEKTGKAKVTATLTQERTGIEMSLSVPVTVNPGPTARIDLNPKSLVMEAGDDHQFSGTAYDEFGNLTGVGIKWSVVGVVGSIDDQGVFRSRKARQAKVRASAGGVFAVADVNVVPSDVAFLKIVPSEITLESGDAMQLHVIGEDKFGNSTDSEVTWNLTNPNLGHIGPDGTLKGMKAGKGEVLAASRNLVDKASLHIKKSELSSIEVLPSSETLEAGEKVGFRARGMDAGGNEVEIVPVWSVKGDIGIIDEQGTFEGRTKGPGAVLASVEGLSGEAHVRVVPGAPAEIAVEPGSLELSAGESDELTVSVRDGYGNLIEDASYSWTMSQDLGTIGADDVFMARTVGQSSLKVTSRTVSFQVPVTVTPGPLAAILVRPGSVEARAGAGVTLEAEGFDTHGNRVEIDPAWSVTGELGVFPEPGEFDARLSGEGYVCAAVGDVAGTADIKVKPGPVTHIEVMPRRVKVEAGSKVDFTAKAYDALGNVVLGDCEWTVVNRKPASITSQGTFSSDIAHRTEVMATAGGVEGHADVEVVSASPVEILVTPSELDLKAGESEKLAVSGLDRFGNEAPVESLMSVVPEELGRFTDGTIFEAIAEGEGIISISAGDLRRTLPVKISTGELKRIEIRLPDEDIRAGKTYELTAVGFDTGGNEIPIKPAWAVSEVIGSIDQDSGRFHARKMGRGVVTVRAGDVTAFSWIEVHVGKLYSLFVIPNQVTIQSGETIDFSIDGLDLEENPVDVSRDAAQWKVVGRIGSFQKPGVFMGTKMGKGKVTAAVGDLIGQAYVTVEPGEPKPDNSRVRLTYPILSADGVSLSDILIVVRDSFDNPVPGVEVTLVTDRQADTLVQPPPTEKSGATRGSISSSKPGVSIVTALVEGAVIPARAEIVFK